MRLIRKKLLSGESGFSLAETLIAILILLMVSAIVAGALPAAANAYQKTVDAANAQLLLSTTMTVLRDELGTATDVSVNSTTTINYKSGNTGNQSLIEVETTGSEKEKGIWLYSYPHTVTTIVSEEVDGESTSTIVETVEYRDVRRIVSEKAATKDLIITCTFAKGTNGEILVKDLEVKKGTNVLAKRTSYTIRPVKKAS